MDAHEYDALLSEAEQRLDRLRALYEQWFQGIERLEPTVVRKDFDRRLDVLRRVRSRNTGLRFRYQQLVQRYTSYATYWRRVGRQIEEGTFRRDLVRARKRQEALKDAPKGSRAPMPTAAEPTVAPAAVAPAAAATGAQEPPVKPAQPAKPPPPPAPGGRPSRTAVPPPLPQHMSLKPAPPAAGTGAAAGISEGELQRLYRDYVAARKQNNERVDNVRYEKLAQTVKELLPKFQEKHPGRPVHFEVVTKNGRVGIKPRP